MKILLIGEQYSNNLGDPLLCQTVEKILKERYPTFEYISYDLSGRKKKMEKESVLIQKGKNVLRLSKKFRKIENYMLIKHGIERIVSTQKIDAAVFVGGEVFMDFFADKMSVILKALYKKRIKVIFHACGMESLSDKSIKMLTRNLDRENIYSISLRDSYDKFTHSFPFLKEKTQETYDTALLCSEYFRPSQIITHDYGIGLIAIESLFEFQVKLIKEMIRRKLNWQVFTNGAPLDYTFAKKVMIEAGVDEKEMKGYIHPRPCATEELVNQITSYRKILSFRMHSLIVALSYGIPCYGFVWDNKVRELFEKIGMQNSFCYPDEQFVFHNKLFMYEKQVIKSKVQKYGSCSQNDLYNTIDGLFEQ